MKQYRCLGQLVSDYKFDWTFFKEYHAFIEARRCRKAHLNQKTLKRYGMEMHHVLPRCFGGISCGKNLIPLYPDEHMFAHNMLQTALWMQHHLHNTPSKALKMCRQHGRGKGREHQDIYKSKTILKAYFDRTASIKLLGYVEG